MKTCIEQIKELYYHIKKNTTTMIQLNKKIEDLLKTNTFECVTEGKIIDIYFNTIEIENSCINTKGNISCFNTDKDNITVSFTFNKLLQEKLVKYNKNETIKLKCLLNDISYSFTFSDKLNLSFEYEAISVLETVDSVLETVDNKSIEKSIKEIEKNTIPNSRFKNRILEIKKLINNKKYIDAKNSLIAEFEYEYFKPTYKINPYKYFDNKFKGTLKFHVSFEKNCLPLLRQNDEIANKISEIDEMTQRILFELPIKESKSGNILIRLLFAILVFIYSIFAVFVSDDYGRFMKVVFFILIAISGLAILFLYIVYTDYVKYEKLIKEKKELESINKKTIAKIIEICNDKGIKITGD